MKPNSAWRTILTAGLICGFLDGVSAIAVAAWSGGTPIRVFQGIASGWLGRSAFQGGIGAALMGVGFHFLVATGAATVYYTASRVLPIMIERALLCGILFGAAVHLFMTFVTIPLSAIGRRPFVLKSFLIYLAVSMVIVGPSIALTIRRLAGPSEKY